MKNIGRAYRKQAKELASISRLFVQAQNQTFGSNANQSLGIVLQAVDDALKSAAEAGKKTSNGADKAFKNAVNMLTDYGRDHHPEEAVAVRMEKAEEEDRSSLKVLNKLKETFRPLEEELTTEVEFLLHESLPDKNPTVVTQVLGKGSKLSEVLWNFSRYKGKKHLTLKQSPHFYKDLPEKYEDDFQRDPIEQFLDALGDSKGDSLDQDTPKPKPKISVLTNRQGRIYLESGQGSRAFGNVWCPQKAIIFKDVCGKLEGEKIVGSSIKGQSNLQYCEEPSHTSANTMEWKPLQDWTEPIRRLLRSQSPDHDVSNIHIISMEQSSPHKSRKVSPSISNTKRTGSGVSPPLSESIQPRRIVVTAGISSKHETAQSPPSPAPIQHQPAATAGVLSNHEIAQPPSPSSAPTQPQPLPVTSNHELAQPSWPLLLPISSPSDRTTPALIPLTKPIPPSQHYQTPPDVAQEQQPQACAFTKETLNISLQVDVVSQFTPNVAVTSHQSRDGDSKNVSSHVDPLGSKLESPTSKVPIPDVTPTPLQTQPQKPAQRTVWQVWYQKIWTGGK